MSSKQVVRLPESKMPGAQLEAGDSAARQARLRLWHWKRQPQGDKLERLAGNTESAANPSDTALEAPLVQRRSEGWRGAQSRTLALLWSAVLLLPALLLGLLVLRMELARPPAWHSGDPLLDRYMVTRARQSDSARGSYSFNLQMRDELNSMQAQYGSDPRVWELACELGSSRRYMPMASTGCELPEALSHAPSSFMLNLRNYERLLNKCESDAEQIEGRGPSYSQKAAYAAYWDRVDRRLIEQSGAVLHEKLQDLQQLVPDEALPFYLEALLSLKGADYDAARDGLRQGNARQSCRLPLGFPLEDYTRLIEAGKQAPDGMAAKGIIEFEYIRSLSRLELGNSNGLRATAASASHSGNQELCAELHIALCRMATAQSCSPYFARACLNADKHLAESLFHQGLCAGSLADYMRAYASADSTLRQLELSLYQNQTNFAGYNAQGRPNTREKITQAVSGPTRQVQQEYEDLVNTVQDLGPGGTVRQAFDALGDVELR